MALCFFYWNSGNPGKNGCAGYSGSIPATKKPDAPENRVRFSVTGSRSFEQRACHQRSIAAVESLYLLGKEEALKEIVTSLSDNTIALGLMAN